MIDVVIPARNEEPTVAGVVQACLGCRFARQVIVVDDGSIDATADRAAGAGAKVISISGGGSKAHALAAGVAASNAGALLFVDADLLGLTADHLDEICEPFVAGRATMSVGWFDYGRWNPLVVRLAPSTGQRIIPRWVFEAIPPHRLDGFTIEIMINEVIAEGRHPTSSRVMKGVTHRTKRDKFGRREGYRQTWQMFWRLVGLPLTGQVRARTYWFYLRGLTVEG
ncbi:MAG: glycosyltransferase family 2 protein [Acidimicrobiales bacterium]